MDSSHVLHYVFRISDRLAKWFSSNAHGYIDDMETAERQFNRSLLLLHKYIRKCKRTVYSSDLVRFTH
jgi:hypothetical protein